MSDIIFFGQTNFRNEKKRFGIRQDDRRRHFYAIGKTGMGKTEMLKNMAVQDIREGHGMGFIDPHGEAVEEILHFVPEHRIQDVVYFNPSDLAHPIAFNVMEQVGVGERHIVASGLMSVFKKIWPDVWSARMEYILNNTILALLECPGSTILGINRMLSDPEYRKYVLSQVTDPVVKGFWVQEFGRYTQRYETEATAAIQNKIGQFVSNPLIRNIAGQEHSSIDMRKIMDEQKILLVNISKGRIGEDNSRLLGGLLITKLQLAAMSRVDIPEEQRKDFYLCIDEFQNFATESFVGVLSEARKYRLSFTLSHQYIAQLEEEVRDAVFGNVGTMVSFRVGAEDAEYLEKEFNPEFFATDFVSLAKYTVYVKLLIDGLAGRPFSATTLAPIPLPERGFAEEIIRFSREHYSTPLSEVERVISEWAGMEQLEKISAAMEPAPEPPMLYDAVCANCKKPTKVVFEPDGKRPVYCKTCRKKMQQQRTSGEPAIQTPAAPAALREPATQSAPAQLPANPSSERSFPKEGLRSALKEALSAAKKGSKKPEEKQKGVLNPGETVYFSE
ncbi:MAG: type IV secretion system DNA-binding domain-containing protein [Candidatus Yanofskybacteria bacterium]|nr:type IV secretion system DNA-binding domain-containing protein [Candidatus Yanofskybacteria bacterium]